MRKDDLPPIVYLALIPCIFFVILDRKKHVVSADSSEICPLKISISIVHTTKNKLKSFLLLLLFINYYYYYYVFKFINSPMLSHSTCPPDSLLLQAILAFYYHHSLSASYLPDGHIFSRTHHNQSEQQFQSPQQCNTRSSQSAVLLILGSRMSVCSNYP